jgi:hypothetical protein
VSIDRTVLPKKEYLIRAMDLQTRGASLDYVVLISEQDVPRKGIFQAQSMS